MATGKINLLEDFTFIAQELSGSSTNLNTCGPGIFYASANTQNTPTSHNYFVISIAYSTSYFGQIALRASNADTYVRTCPGSWTAWKKITS